MNQNLPLPPACGRLSSLITRVVLLLACALLPARAWDYESHRAINLAALASLPAEFPAFVKSPEARERIAFLAGEPDRWRNTPDLPLKHRNGPDHYIDIEELATYGLNPELLPVFRYDFVASLALIRKENPEKFDYLRTGKNEDHTREVLGLLPWGMVELYGKLKSGFSYLKAYEEHGGTSEEIANAQANIIYVMGVMGHLYGDASQPLHTTVHHHGWTGPNPHGYSTSRGIHSWIDGGYFQKTGGMNPESLAARTRPARLVRIGDRDAKPEEMFQAGMLFILAQHQQVEPLYRMDKEGKFSGEGEKGLEGRPFLEEQLLRSAQFLGDAWFSAWQQAPPDTFLRGQLTKRARVLKD
jgi:hypothetical protein